LESMASHFTHSDCMEDIYTPRYSLPYSFQLFRTWGWRGLTQAYNVALIAVTAVFPDQILLVNQLFRSLSFNKNIELYFLTEEKVA
jgi:hypothetical protein